MKILKWLGLGAVGVVLIGVLVLAIVYVATGPEGPPAGSVSEVALGGRRLRRRVS